MELKKNIEDLRILVIGDIMLDRYVVGDVKRISPEAPVAIVNVTNEYSTLGGCGNVIRNLRTIGAQVLCSAKIGQDKAGEEIINQLNTLKVEHKLIEGRNYTTIQKERIIADDRQIQLLRIDREYLSPFNDIVDYEFYSDLPGLIDIIIISDYAKGMITNKLMQYIKSLGIKIIVDPKPSNEHLYKNVFMITPNNEEFKQMEISHVKYVLRTMGKDGMVLYDRETGNNERIPSNPVNVYNVSGAGDTVVAIMGICLSLDLSPYMSATIANQCAEYVVEQPGTSVVPKEIFNKIIYELEDIKGVL